MRATPGLVGNRRPRSPHAQRPSRAATGRMFAQRLRVRRSSCHQRPSTPPPAPTRHARRPRLPSTPSPPRKTRRRPIARPSWPARLWSQPTRRQCRPPGPRIQLEAQWGPGQTPPNHRTADARAKYASAPAVRASAKAVTQGCAHMCVVLREVAIGCRRDGARAIAAQTDACVQYLPSKAPSRQSDCSMKAESARPARGRRHC